jgi:acetyl esterase/lipase
MNDKFPPTYIMDTQKRSFDQEGMRLASRLEELGVPYKTNIYERKLNLPHAFYILSKYEQSHEVLGDIFDFFNQYCDTN